MRMIKRSWEYVPPSWVHLEIKNMDTSLYFDTSSATDMRMYHRVNEAKMRYKIYGRHEIRNMYDVCPVCHFPSYAEKYGNYFDSKGHPRYGAYLRHYENCVLCGRPHKEVTIYDVGV